MKIEVKYLKALWIGVFFLLLVLSFQNCSKNSNKFNSSSTTEEISNKNPTILFKSSFGPGVSLDAVTKFTDEGAWQEVIGTDKESGFTWPVDALDSTFTGIQMITKDPVTSLNVSDYAINSIQSVIGPNGKTVNALYQSIKNKEPAGVWGAQSPLIIHRPWTVGDVTELYISYWYKNPKISFIQLDNEISGANTLVQFQFKTGGYENTWRGDYRFSTVIKKDVDGSYFWQAHSDNNANGPDPDELYWEAENHDVSVPIDEWYKVEIYWYRSSSNNGYFWVAINGDTIVDHQGANMGKYGFPINRIMIDSLYTGGHGPVEGNLTELEIWNGFPCGWKTTCF